MKKFKAITALFVLSVLTMSCKKDSVRQPANNSNNGVVNSPLAGFSEHTIISPWFSLELFPISDRTEFYLEGTEYFANAIDYDKSQHVELAYVMMPGERVPVFRRLPMKLAVLTDARTDEFNFQFGMDHVGFTLTVKNMDPTVISIDPAITEEFKYQYIVIPKSTYYSLSVDWDNYEEVAQALGI